LTEPVSTRCRWYKRALELSQQVETIRQAAEAGEEAHEADMQVQGAEAGPETPPAGVVCDPERVSGELLLRGGRGGGGVTAEVLM
jgi:hypothetical protein